MTRGIERAVSEGNGKKKAPGEECFEAHRVWLRSESGGCRDHRELPTLDQEKKRRASLSCYSTPHWVLRRVLTF